MKLSISIFIITCWWAASFTNAVEIASQINKTTADYIRTAVAKKAELVKEKLAHSTIVEDVAASTDKPKDSSSTDKPKDSSSTDKPKDSSSTDKPKDSSSTDKPKDSSSTDKPKDSSSTDKPKDSSSTDRNKDKGNGYWYPIIAVAVGFSSWGIITLIIEMLNRRRPMALTNKKGQ